MGNRQYGGDSDQVHGGLFRASVGRRHHLLAGQGRHGRPRVVQPRKARGAQGAFWLKIIGLAAGCERIVIDHITRIDPACAPDWPQPDEGVGDHRVIVDGDPQLNIVVRADVPGGTRTAGGNTTAANRLLGAIEWPATQKAGIYDGLDVPLHPPLPAEVEAQRWSFR